MQEIFSVQDHKHYLSCVTVSKELDKVATAGDNWLVFVFRAMLIFRSACSVKMRELSQLSQVYAIIELDAADKELERVAFNADGEQITTKQHDCAFTGQLMSVSTASGTLHVYVTKVPVLGVAAPPALALLTSLTEITYYSDFGDSASQCIVFC